MAVNRWLGTAPNVAQTVTLLVGSNTATHTFTTTINGKSITVTADGVLTTAQIAAAIQSLLANSTIPEFQEVSWSVASSTVTGVANTPGVPFTVSKSGTGTYTLTTTVANSGAWNVDVAANWSLGAVPTTGDDVLVDGGGDILYGFAALSADALASLRVKASFEGKAIGLPFRNPAGYVEYRARAWTLATAVPVTIGEGDGGGPARVNLVVTTAANVTVRATGNRPDPTVPAVNISGAASGTLTVIGGDVGLAADDDTLSATLTAATIDGTASTLTVGKGATIATLTHDGGTTLSPGTVTTLNITGGSATLYTAPTTVTADGGAVDCRFTGTAATMTFRGQGTTPPPLCECGNDPRGRTFTDHTFTGGAVLHDPDKSLTMTNAGTWDRASVSAADFGARFSLKRT